MKVCFIYAEKDGEEEGRELILAKAFTDGVAADGIATDIITKSEAHRKPPDADIVCMVGVKSLKLFREMRALGKRVIYFDKGYFRHRGPNRTWEYWRVALDDHHPTAYIEKANHSRRRWSILASRRAIEVKPWRGYTCGHIVYAGSSEKYHAFAGLSDPTSYAERVIKQLKELSQRKVIYRPKPTWFDASPVKGAVFSPRNESIADVLQGAWCLVTNGSNASYDAVLMGIPCVVLGNAIAKPISSQDLKDVESPKEALDEEREQWLANLAWCMFTEAEMRKGMAWKTIKPQLTGEFIDEDTIPSLAYEGIRPSKAILKKLGSWKKDRPKRTKEEQRATKPFKKGRAKDELSG